jgi:hypothetical protein
MFCGAIHEFLGNSTKNEWQLIITVFFVRCPPAMQIFLYMLKAWLGSNPFVTSFTRQTAFRSCCCTRAWQFGRSHVGQRTRRALKMALIAAQESSVVHSARALPTDPRGWGNWYSFQKQKVEIYHKIPCFSIRQTINGFQNCVRFRTLLVLSSINLLLQTQIWSY